MEHELLCFSKNIKEEELQDCAFKAVDYGMSYIVVPCGLLSNWKDYMQGADTKIASCISFPQGTSSTKLKIHGILEAAGKGVSAIDVVINNTFVSEKNWTGLGDELEACLKACRDNKLDIRAVLEYRLFETKDVIDTCKIIKDVGIPTVVTATGTIVDNCSDSLTIAHQIQKKAKISVIATAPITRKKHYDAYLEAKIYGIRFLSVYAMKNVIDKIVENGV